MTTPKPRPTIVPGESHSYPVLPLRDIVVFPHMIVPLFVGREKSIRALEEVMKNDALIMLATQKNASDDDPSPDSMYEIGTLASVLPRLKRPGGTGKVLGEGLGRARREDAQCERVKEHAAQQGIVERIAVEARCRVFPGRVAQLAWTMESIDRGAEHCVPAPSHSLCECISKPGLARTLTAVDREARTIDVK